MKFEQESCVAVNVYVSCDKCDKKDKCERIYEPCNPEKDDKKDCHACVDVNVYVECEKKR